MIPVEVSERAIGVLCRCLSPAETVLMSERQESFLSRVTLVGFGHRERAGTQGGVRRGRDEAFPCGRMLPSDERSSFLSPWL